MANTILIDGNSIGYAAHSARELTANGRQVQAIFFSLKMIKSMIDRMGSNYDRLIVLWDTKAKWRFDIHPEYKGKRDNDPVKKASRQAYKEQVPEIRKALSLLGVEQVFAKNEEADDLAGAMVLNRKPGDKILLVSGDKDWVQLVCEDVDWYDPREDGNLITAATFQEKTSFANPVLFSQAKAILGDSSDNISGVDGIGEKCLALLIGTFGSIPKFIQAAQEHKAKTGREFEKEDLPGDFSRFRKKLNAFAFGDGLEVFKRNMQLMNLLSKRHRGTEILSKTVSLKTSFDKAGFEEFCHERAFMSIAKHVAQWELTFNPFVSAK